MAAPAPSVACTDRGSEPAQTGQCHECAVLTEQVARLLDLILSAGVEPPDLGRRPSRAIPQGMTVRQVEVGILIARGHSNAQIAERLYLGVNSVKTHVRGLFRTLGVHNRTEAALTFVRLGLVEPAAAEGARG